MFFILYSAVLSCIPSNVNNVFTISDIPPYGFIVGTNGPTLISTSTVIANTGYNASTFTDPLLPDGLELSYKQTDSVTTN